jgi:hypothetical protein
MIILLVVMNVTIVTIKIKIHVSSVRPVPKVLRVPQVQQVRKTHKVLSVHKDLSVIRARRDLRGFPEVYSAMQTFTP